MQTEEWPITHRSTIYTWHCDQIGHMNVMWYTGKFDEATWQFFSLFGCTPSYMMRLKRGMVAVDQHLTYKRELLAGSIIHIRSGILEVKEKSIRFMHEMFNSETNDLAATSTLVGVHIDTVARKAVPFPENIFVNATKMIVQLPK